MFYLSKFCLLCLKEDDGKFENIENKGSNDVSIQEKLDYCVFELISSGHEFPGYVCQKCLEDVEKFYNFKQKCFNNNRKIRNLMDSLKQMHFSGISFRDLSIPIKDIKYSIKPRVKQKSININKKSDLKVMKNLLSETKLNKSTGMFQCEDCPKQFHMKSQLVRHLVTHTKPKYECDICKKIFGRKGNLEIHKQTHGNKFKTEMKLNKSENDIKPKKLLDNSQSTKKMFECGICFKQFSFKHNLKRHFTTFHLEHNKSNINLSYNIVEPVKQNILNSTMNSIDLTDDSSESDVEMISYNKVADIIELKDELKTKNSAKQMHDEIMQTNSKNNASPNKLSETQEKLITKKNLKETEENLQCFICDMTFTRNCKLHMHVRTHFEETPYVH